MSTPSTTDATNTTRPHPQKSDSINITNGEPWVCQTCTFVNQDSLHLSCQLCGEPRAESNLDKYKNESNLQSEKRMAASTKKKPARKETIVDLDDDFVAPPPPPRRTDATQRAATLTKAARPSTQTKAARPSTQTNLDTRIRAKVDQRMGAASLSTEEQENDYEQLRPGAYSVTLEDQEDLQAVIQRQTTGFISPHATTTLNLKTKTDASSQKSCGSESSTPPSKFDDSPHQHNEETVLVAEVVNDNELEEEIRQRLLQEQEQDKPDVEEQVRQRILREAVQAEVVTTTQFANDGATSVVTNASTTSSSSASLRPTNIKQQLFGDTRKSHIDIASSPEAIRTRNLLPSSVYLNETTKMWIASVNTNQKALETNDTTEAAKGLKTFSFASKRVAQQAALQMAPPRMLPFSENPTCHICKAKFAVFRRPCHCRNCGVCICSACAATWPAKMVPSTYNVKNNLSVNVCLACDWLSTSFRTALFEGDYDKVMNLYKTGNINVASPFANIKGEHVYPVHCAAIGGNLKLLKWLVDRRSCPIQSESRRGGLGPLLTSKGRSLLGIALANKRVDFIRYLVVDKGMTFADERDLDVVLALENFTTVLGLVPEEIVDPSAKEEEDKSAFGVV